SPRQAARAPPRRSHPGDGAVLARPRAGHDADPARAAPPRPDGPDDQDAALRQDRQPPPAPARADRLRRRARLIVYLGRATPALLFAHRTPSPMAMFPNGPLTRTS